MATHDAGNLRFAVGFFPASSAYGVVDHQKLFDHGQVHHATAPAAAEALSITPQAFIPEFVAGAPLVTQLKVTCNCYCSRDIVSRVVIAPCA